MSMFPRGGMFVAWTNAWLDGRASLDEADIHTVAGDAVHRMVGLNHVANPTGSGGKEEPLALSIGLSQLRSLGVTSVRLVLPVPGDASGLPGPRTFNEAAISAREAVVAQAAVPLGLIPTVASSGQGVVVRWDVELVDPDRSVPSGRLSEHERDLAVALQETTAAMEGLDLAKDRPDLADRLRLIDREVGQLVFPPTLSARRQRLISTATRLASIIAWASEDDGAAITSAQAHARTQAFAPMSAAARRSLIAAYGGRADDDD